MSNPTDTARLRELLGAATKGPWEVECVQTSVGRCFKIGPFPSRREDRPNWACVYDDSYGGVSHGNEELKANAHCITELHNAAPAMLDELDALRARVAELEARAKWRPISEVHEDYGDIILINIDDPGDVRLSHVCSLSWDEDRDGMTHFAQVPELTTAFAARIREGGE